MLPKITLILLFVKAIYCEDNFNIEWENASAFSLENTATQCLKSVIMKYFPCGTLITLVDDTSDGKLVQYLNDEQHCYSYILRSYNDQDWNITTPMYVIRAENVTEFSKGILTIINDLFFNARGRFIIQLKSSNDKDADHVFRILMAHRAFDSILIRQTDTNELVINTYYPFKGSNCAKTLEVATIGNCNDVASLKWVKNEDISFKNCTIKGVAVDDIPNFINESSAYSENGKPILGIEQLFLETAAQKEDMKIEYVLVTTKDSYGVVLPNRTATGLLSYLQKYDVDIATGGFILMQNRAQLFDYVWGFNYVAFKVFTPAADEEIWRDVYKEFSGKTWILILIAYCIFAVISRVKQKLLLKRSRQEVPMALKLWGYFYSNTCSKLSKENKLRVLMTFWIWFTFFICNFYNTALYSLLTGREQVKRQISVDRLNELPFEPCISDPTREFYWFSYEQNLPSGHDIPECKYSDNALKYVATYKSAYAIEMDYEYMLNQYKYYDHHEGKPMLDTWMFSINNVVAMYLVRGFPLRDKFQLNALRMQESGILQHQLEKISYQKNAEVMITHLAHFQKITLSDLRIHFGALFVGSMLSVLCLVTEIYWHRHSTSLNVKFRSKFQRKPLYSTSTS